MTGADFRESEAQTVPYTTDHVVPEGESPEILTLGAFTYGNGLPMGQTEVLPPPDADVGTAAETFGCRWG